MDVAAGTTVDVTGGESVLGHGIGYDLNLGSGGTMDVAAGAIFDMAGGGGGWKGVNGYLGWHVV